MLRATRTYGISNMPKGQIWISSMSTSESVTAAIAPSSRRYHLPLHIGDWLRETRHLSPLGRDGYLHLKIEYWSRGCLPDDDTQLARIAGMTMAQWRRERPAIEKLFLPGWRHERLDAELVRVRADIRWQY